MKSVQIRRFFWSVFPRIRTDYGEMFLISPYSVQMRQNTDQNKLRIWTLFTQSKVFISSDVLPHDINFFVLLRLNSSRYHEINFNSTCFLRKHDCLRTKYLLLSHNLAFTSQKSNTCLSNFFSSHFFSVRDDEKEVAFSKWRWGLCRSSRY